MINFFKYIWNWIKSSNHSLHIVGCFLITVPVFFMNKLVGTTLTATIASVITVAIAACIIELYQCLVAKKNVWDWQDILSDGIGLVLGLILCYFAVFHPVTFGVINFLISGASIITFTYYWFKKNKNMQRLWAAIFIVFLLIAFSSFIAA